MLVNYKKDANHYYFEVVNGSSKTLYRLPSSLSKAFRINKKFHKGQWYLDLGDGVPHLLKITTNPDFVEEINLENGVSEKIKIFEQKGTSKNFLDQNGKISENEVSIVLNKMESKEAKVFTPPSPPDVPNDVQLFLDHQKVEKDSLTNVVLRTSGFKYSNNGSIDLSYDAKVIQFVDFNANNPAVKIDSSNHPNGKIKISWGNLDSSNLITLGDNDSLVSIKFKAIGERGERSDVKIEQAIILESNKSSITQCKSGSISINKPFVVVPPGCFKWLGLLLLILFLAILFWKRCEWLGIGCEDLCDPTEFFEKYYNHSDEQNTNAILEMIDIDMSHYYGIDVPDRDRVREEIEIGHGKVDSSFTTIISTPNEISSKEIGLDLIRSYSYGIEYEFYQNGQKNCFILKIESDLVIKNDSDNCFLKSIKEVERKDCDGNEDADEDGIQSSEDCDDANPNIGKIGGPCDNGNGILNSDCDCIVKTPPINNEDNDGDGVLSSADCDDNDPNKGRVGDRCDDGDASTKGDILDSNCNCKGNPPGFDCTNYNRNIGDSCDDQNDDTQNDRITSDCQCIGVPIEGKTTYYFDKDGDGKGDPDDKKEFGKGDDTSGYVRDYSDRCPTRDGGGSADGCPEFSMSGPISANIEETKNLKINFQPITNDEVEITGDISLNLVGNNTFTPSINPSELGMMNANISISNSNDGYDASVSVNICVKLTNEYFSKNIAPPIMLHGRYSK